MSRIINNKKGKTMNNETNRERYSVEEQHHIIGSAHQPAAPQPKKKKRVFMWVFLAIQAIFIFWLIAGITSAGGDADTANGVLTQQEANDAAAVGTGIGVMLVLVLWCIVDFLMLAVWAVTRLARRR